MKTFHNAKKVYIDWIKFDSKIEWDYYLYLKELQSKWIIIRFTIQPSYELIPKFNKGSVKYMKTHYIADFAVYYEDKTIEVIDIKWMPTEQSKIKRKMFDFRYPDIPLRWLVKYKWERVDYFDNKKRQSTNKREKKKSLNI